MMESFLRVRSLRGRCVCDEWAGELVPFHRPISWASDSPRSRAYSFVRFGNATPRPDGIDPRKPRLPVNTLDIVSVHIRRMRKSSQATCSNRSHMEASSHTALQDQATSYLSNPRDLQWDGCYGTSWIPTAKHWIWASERERERSMTRAPMSNSSARTCWRQ